MKIKLSPQRKDYPITTSVVGDVITIDGIEYDFSPLKYGETLPSGAAGDVFSGDITRDESGEICLTLVLPHGANAPEETRFPEYFDKYMVVTDGAIELPPYDMEVTND